MEFNIGDKVVTNDYRKNNVGPYFAPQMESLIGKVGTIVGSNGSGNVLVKHESSNQTWYWHVSALSRPKAKDYGYKAKDYGYKVGDLFKVISNQCSVPKGCYLVFVEDDGTQNPYFKEADQQGEIINSDYRCAHLEDLELVTVGKKTPAQELGYKVGDKFELTSDRSLSWKKGMVITLDRDDGTDIPRFKANNGDTSYVKLERVKPYKAPSFKVGDFVRSEKWAALPSDNRYYRVTRIEGDKFWLYHEGELSYSVSEHGPWEVQDPLQEVKDAFKAGKPLQFRNRKPYDGWMTINEPSWDNERWEYRIKPVEDVIHQVQVYHYGGDPIFDTTTLNPNLELIFDGETGKLKAGKVL